MISDQSTLNLFAASVVNKETAINTFRACDQSLVVAEGDFIQIVPMRGVNEGDATGTEEPTEFYDDGRSYKMSVSPKYATYNHLAFLLSYGLGACVSSAVTDGYSHVITPIDGFVDNQRSNPTFTAVQRLGGGTEWIRVASGAVQSVSETYEVGSPLAVSANIVFTGKYEKNVREETVYALDNVTSLTLSNEIYGATAAERLDSVASVRVSYNGIDYQYITPTDSAATSGLTIPSLGGSGSQVAYKVLFRHLNPSWIPLPSAVSEPHIKVTAFYFTIGGSWNGTDFQGGRTICYDFGSLKVDFSNEGLEPKMTPCNPDPDVLYGGLLKRTGRSHTITLDKDLSDALMGALYDSGETIGLHIITEGPLMSGSLTERYSYERVFPRLAMMDRQFSTSDKRNKESLTLRALEDPTYGSTIAKIVNQQAGYAA